MSDFRILLIGDSDSQLLACEVLCQSPSFQGVDVTINVIPREGTPDLILSRIDRLGRIWRHDMGKLLTHPELQGFDAIGVYLTGSKISDFRIALDLLPESKRPLLFCGFNGVVLEKFLEGLSWRLGYDLISLSGPRDREAMERMIQHTPYEQQLSVLVGLRRNGPLEREWSAQAERPRQFLFAEQVVMPSNQEDRAEMVRILADLARRSPNWQVLIKPRIAPGESTFHALDAHISETLRQSIGQPPENLTIDYRPMPELLRSSRLMATVSSTAFFDALDFGCRPLVMADFGINPGYGSHVFAGSGVWSSLKDVVDLDALDQQHPDPDQQWLSWMGYGDGFHPEDLVEALIDLKNKPRQRLKNKSGYLTNANLSFTQLRRNAETAIKARNWEEAASLLMLGTLLRPTHRNVARRLSAVRQLNPVSRALLLLLTYRDVG
jgi:hypothetical protein